MTGIGADRPIRRRSTNAEDCPQPTLDRRPWKVGAGWIVLKNSWSIVV